jgi:hypothetical protein
MKFRLVWPGHSWPLELVSYKSRMDDGVTLILEDAIFHPTVTEEMMQEEGST